MSDSASMTPASRLQADRDLARRSVGGIFAYLILWGIVVSFSHLADTHAWLIWSVGAIYVALGALRLALVWRFDALHGRSPDRWRRLFALGALSSGAIWGGFCGFALFVGGLNAPSILVLLPTAGIAAGAVAALAPRRGLMMVMLVLLLWPAIPMSILAGNALGMGVALMFLTYYAFLLLIGRRLHEEYWRAARQNAEVETLAGQVRAILDTVVDGIITIDERGRVETFNPAAARIFGYGAGEVIGRNINMLMPDPFHSAHDGYLANYLNTGERRIIGIGREVMGRRKDGSVFPLDLAVSETRLGERRVFTGLVRDITERKKVERLKSEFVSTVSHELRTPLTSIRGALGLIAAGVVGVLPDKARELIDIAHQNSERLSQLINDLLDIEKIESGRMRFVPRPHSIRALIEQSIVANAAYGQQFGVDFRLLEGEPGLLANVDADRFMQVMANLLSNAAKFSPAGSTVEVSAERRDASVRVSVRDRGTGIPEEFRPRVFQKFSQADGSDTRAKGGTGLGLSIVKAIVGQFGGSVDFETGPDGTTFFFDLPLLDARPLHAGGRELPRVLVCEDDADVARLIALMLEHAGFAADVVHSAAQARNALDTGSYQAMTLDLLLPGEDGVALIKALREDTRTRALPVVVVSGIADHGRAQLNGGFGIVDWLDKPIDEKRLVAAVESAMGRASAVRPRVLHVEDDADVRRIVASLGARLADFDQAETLEEAKGKLALERYALVILDVGLPDGSGWELLPLIRALDPPPPVLVFSGAHVGADGAPQVASALVKANASNEDIVKTIRGLLRG